MCRGETEKIKLIIVFNPTLFAEVRISFQYTGLFEGSERRISRTPLARIRSSQRSEIEAGVIWNAAMWRFLTARRGVFLILSATKRMRSHGFSLRSRICF